MDISVHRNYFGSQVASTVTPMDLEPAFLAELSRDDEPAALAKEGPPSGVFIRAPAIVALGQRATALAWVSLPPGAAPLSVATAVSLATPQPVCVAARQGRCLATAFHPELTAHRAFHRLFVRMVAGAGGAGARGGPLPPAGSPDAAAAGGSHGAPAAVLADIPLPIAPLGVLPAVIGSPAVGPRLTPGTTAASSCLK